MVKTYSLSGGGPGPIQSVLRALFVLAAAVGGFFILAASAVLAFAVALGLLIFGAVVFLGFWLRAKITGRSPLDGMSGKASPFVQMHSFKSNASKPSSRKANEPKKDDGPVIDAHKTPDGWSVDTD